MGKNIAFRKLNKEKLKAYGFIDHSYETAVMDGTMTLSITIADDGSLDSHVSDKETGEEYVLYRVKESKGAFVNKLRTETGRIIDSIISSCYDADVFKGKQAKEIISTTEQRYGDTLEYPWGIEDGAAVIRNRKTRKWYVLLMVVPKKRLTRKDKDEGNAEVLNLHLKEETIAFLVDGKTFFPGYHMNKRHWISILLDGSLPRKEWESLIEESHSLS